MFSSFYIQSYNKNNKLKEKKSKDEASLTKKTETLDVNENYKTIDDNKIEKDTPAITMDQLRQRTVLG